MPMPPSYSSPTTSVSFTPHTFKSPQQEMVSHSFTIDQELSLENHLIGVMMDKINASPRGMDPQEYLQGQAYHQGRIDILQYILGVSRNLRSGERLLAMETENDPSAT